MLCSIEKTSIISSFKKYGYSFVRKVRLYYESGWLYWQSWTFLTCYLKGACLLWVDWGQESYWVSSIRDFIMSERERPGSSGSQENGEKGMTIPNQSGPSGPR